jgi:hypothetical protein
MHSTHEHRGSVDKDTLLSCASLKAER